MFKIFSYVFFGLTAITILATIILNVFWLVKICIELYKTIKKYNITKNRTDFHPLYKDVQSLSQSMELYNYKSHMAKFVIVISICGVELFQFVFTYLSRLIFILIPKPEELNVTLFGVWDFHLTCNYAFEKYYSHPFIIVFFDLDNATYILLMVLLSVLTRFLSLRYLRHPVRPVLMKYLAWLLLQYALIALASTIYTYPIMFLLIPSFFIINWLLFVKESLLLSRVLKMNVKELMWHSPDRIFFNNQLLAYKHYKFFRILLILSLFISVILVCLLFFATGFKAVLCFSQAFPLSPTAILIKDVMKYIDPIFLFLWLVSYGLPLWVYSAACFILKYSNRNQQYRFNYSNIRPLLRNS
ncbi:hypothetical protein LOD99_2639 [Oopsacas minuta]|uniref:Uncharacterized protein n=1 Tax=Oopsacas minuta TaxID=111878 RepID=A0AAV7K2J5_9METZ|nr:hypothetical protein LOD99_2639 [Oopsacas minuta]